MTKKRAVLSRLVQLFLLGFCSSLLFVWIQANPPATATAITNPAPPFLPTLFTTIAQLPAKEQLRTNAQIRTRQGFEEFNQGRASAALQLWSESTKIYRQLQSREGIVGSLINQNLALQALGFYPQACKTLLQALELDSWVCETFSAPAQAPVEPGLQLAENILALPNMPVRVTGLRHLGNVLRVIGKPNEAEIVLNSALTMANGLTSTSEFKDILLSLANTERALYSRTQDGYERTDDPVLRHTAIKVLLQKAKSALSFYQQVGDTHKGDKQENTQKLAFLNRLSLLVELEQWLAGQAKWESPDLNALQAYAQSQLQPLVEQLLLDPQFEGLSTIQSVYARLNLINSLIQINKNPKLNSIAFQLDKNRGMNTAFQVAEDALRISRSVSDKRAESYTLGTYGSLYRQTNQLALSKQYLSSALNAGQFVQAWDAVYQWQQQLGQIYQIEGQEQKAIQAYDAAIRSLEQIRGDILSANPDIQFSFKQKVEPVYREYLRLLLSEQHPNLQRVIQTNEQLQLAELENYLQCGKLDLVSLDSFQNLPDAPAIIHVLNLGNRIEVIVRSPDGSLHRYSPDPEQVRRNTKNLLANLQDTRLAYINEPLLNSYSLALYKLLIAPARESGFLPKRGTLVFVLDSSLQSLPMSLLHDGQNYLLKNYRISVALGSQLQQPKVMPSRQRALIAGLSRESPSFSDPRAPRGLTPLPEVESEVEDIKKNITSTVELLNDKFTSSRFQTEMRKYDFPIVHITTHGQFSSDPEQTVILAWNQALNVRQLHRLLKGNRDAIELLVLSACQTAKGDKRSALGIAGVAAQAGARSTVAALWLVDAGSTAKLMGEFYKGLSRGMSKAEALRQAQLMLLSTPKYQHPYYWAGFILVGSWL